MVESPHESVQGLNHICHKFFAVRGHDTLLQRVAHDVARSELR